MPAVQTSLLAFVTILVASVSAQSGSGVTTRYWDCCKTSCAWSGKASVSSPVRTCDISNNPLSDVNAKSGCDGGTAYACANNSPWAVSDSLSYGFAAVNLAGSSESQWCCSCYELTFTSGPVAGKQMIVQATNTGGDVGGSQFDIMIPGGGVGAFPSGCTNQYGSISGWGATYGGVSSRSQCDSLPSALRVGCQWRFDWFMGADNPNVTWRKVACPSAITGITGCIRSDDGTAPPPSSVTPTSSTSNAGTTTTTASGSGQTAWGQCGGEGWAGPTTCISGYKCQFTNQWYSQCVPT
ncbi:hypothetical protein FRC02_004671 [Tulasnella sp. 418]|nr:hypothetical protein FRC02_004671 [Tulasnella sp. 418]